MDCSLWLNRKKISSAAQIPDNLDIASLRGYFLAGSLIRWLEEHGGGKYAAKLDKLSPDDPALNDKIARIFGGKPLPAKPLDGASSAGSLGGSACSFRVGGASFKMPNSFRFTNTSFYAFGGSGSAYFSELSSFLAYLSGKFGGSFVSSGFAETSFSQWKWLWEFFGSYSGGSFASSSFAETSFSRWEWLWEFFGSYSGGSFASTSFAVTSFSQWEWLWEFFRSYSGGSFVSSSFAVTSFSQWEWLWEFFRSYSGGSFVSTSFFGASFSGWERFFGSFAGGFGSYRGGSFPETIPAFLDEYDLVMFKTLMMCPLDRFGYGIHII